MLMTKTLVLPRAMILIHSHDLPFGAQNLLLVSHKLLAKLHSRLTEFT